MTLTSYDLSEKIHEDYGQVSGILFDQFTIHLVNNHHAFTSVTFENEERTRFYRIEKDYQMGDSEKKNLGLNISFLNHLINNKNWPRELYHVELQYLTKGKTNKTINFSIENSVSQKDIDDINQEIVNFVLDEKNQ